MRAVAQRCRSAAVRIGGTPVTTIGPGLVVLVGVEQADEAEDVAWLAGKLARLRIFADDQGRMHHSLLDLPGHELLVVSQFTLHASTRRGNRPSFIRAAGPEHSEPLYEAFLETLERLLDRAVARGRFGAEMEVELVNAGPVTLWLDSRQRE